MYTNLRQNQRSLVFCCISCLPVQTVCIPQALFHGPGSAFCLFSLILTTLFVFIYILIFFILLANDTVPLLTWWYPPRGSDHLRLSTQVRPVGSCQRLSAALMNSSRLTDRRVTGLQCWCTALSVCVTVWLIGYKLNEGTQARTHTHKHTSGAESQSRAEVLVAEGVKSSLRMQKEREEMILFSNVSY